VKIRSRYLTKCATWFAAILFRLLFTTCRKVQLVAKGHLRFDADDDERYILCAWHDSLLFPTFGADPRLRRITSCLTSRHHDGSYISDMMERLGLHAVRGSTNHGGAEAIRQLMDEAADRHVVITPDGPRGPRRQLKAGAVFLASQTGRRLMVTGFSCRSGWRIQGKWTDMLIPRPFTTIYLVPSAPITIPPDLSRVELDRTVQEVQREFDKVNARAETLAHGTPTPQTIAPRAAA